MFFFFFFNDTATTEIYTLSLHDALPICAGPRGRPAAPRLGAHGDRARVRPLREVRLAPARRPLRQRLGLGAHRPLHLPPHPPEPRPPAPRPPDDPRCPHLRRPRPLRGPRA